MSHTLSSRLQQLAPSGTMAMKAAAEERRRAKLPVFDLTAGEPDFGTPLAARWGGSEAIRDGHTRYTEVAGIPELRQVIARDAKGQGAYPFTAAEIFISAGAKPVLYQLFLALLSTGNGGPDEVIIPSPYWTSYPEQVKLAGGQPVFVDTLETGFVPDFDRIVAKVTDKTQAIMLCSPNNPTGAIIPAETLKALAEFCQRQEIYLVVDEVYLDYWYKQPPVSALNYFWPGMIVVNAASKSLAMTGWRLGWAVADPEIIAALTLLQSQTLTCASTVAQWAVLRALQSSRSYLQEWRTTYKQRRDQLLAAFKQVPDLAWAQPDGAFYLFLDCRKILARKTLTSSEFAHRLLATEGVGVVPGEAFGAPGFLRLSYATSSDVLAEAAARMVRVFNTI